jgi:deferrochelatase/peroxidase EfeB
VDDGKERGLHFICLNSDIERQFEFVQQTWINNPVFGGLNGEVDPLIGYVAKGDAIMTVPADPVRTRIHNIRRFVRVKGGAYFFLPGIRALRYLASVTG